MINFRPFTLKDKEIYEQYLFTGYEHGCEYSFANRYLWGRQEFAVIHGHVAVLMKPGGRAVYSYPLGDGNKQEIFDAIIADAKERGNKPEFFGLTHETLQTLESCCPGKFEFTPIRNSFDYVYDINDLAELKGKRYHRKRNHYNRFRTLHPDYTVQPVTPDNLPAVRQMTDEWYAARQQENPDIDYRGEQTALDKAISGYEELGLEGLILANGEDILAVTMGSRLSEDTFDVHFEKARPDADGAYAAINCEFAGYIRQKYPEVRFLNREEDMGLEGLRKAKESYLPHHMVEKYRASCTG